jgi:hypothetical protein
MKKRKIFAVNNFQIVVTALTHERWLHNDSHSPLCEQGIEIGRKH